MQASNDDYWVVRCAPVQTLELVGDLNALGFEAWSPIAEREIRLARSKKYVRVVEPMLATFIFVLAGQDPHRCAQRLDDLRHTLGIRVMRDNGNYAGTSAASLEPLRAIEREAATFGIDNMVAGDQYEIGQRGSINANAFLGLSCTLVGRRRSKLLILIDGATSPIEIKPAIFVPK